MHELGDDGILSAPHVMEYPYRRSLGPVLGRFFTGLRDGRIEGNKTRAGRVLVPPMEYDPETGDDVSDEWVEVSWTLATPEDDKIPNDTDRRRHRILRLLRQAAEQSAAPTVEALADALDVSPRTIKRDLAALRATGHPVPTRGART